MVRIIDLESKIKNVFDQDKLFHAGAAKDDIESFEGKFGVNFHQELKDYFLISNGQVEALPIIEGYWFCSLEQSFNAWKSISEELDQGYFDGLEAISVGPVKPLYHSTARIPILISDNQNISVDLDPDNGGRLGQIVEVLYDEELRVVVAESISQFVDKIINLLESNELTFNENFQYFASSEMGTFANLFGIYSG